jgi:uncharacterized protein
MSQENVEIVRLVYDGWSKGDFREPARLFDPHIVFVLHPGFPEPGAYFGFERFIEYSRGLLEPWEKLTIEADEVIEVGSAVLASVHQRGVGRHSGAVTELRYFHLWSLRGPKVIRFDGFRERAQALEAAGLSE